VPLAYDELNPQPRRHRLAAVKYDWRAADGGVTKLDSGSDFGGQSTFNKTKGADFSDYSRCYATEKNAIGKPFFHN